MFERLADAQNWPDSERILLLQCVFTGKAQKAYAGLSAEQCTGYKMVKEAVLKAYELVPEEYWQRFRSWKKGGKQTHVEFTSELVTHFGRWCSASSVVSFEQFKQSLPGFITTYINERKVTTPEEGVRTHGRICFNPQTFLWGAMSTV